MGVMSNMRCIACWSLNFALSFFVTGGGCLRHSMTICLLYPTRPENMSRRGSNQELAQEDGFMSYEDAVKQ